MGFPDTNKANAEKYYNEVVEKGVNHRDGLNALVWIVKQDRENEQMYTQYAAFMCELSKASCPIILISNGTESLNANKLKKLKKEQKSVEEWRGEIKMQLEETAKKLVKQMSFPSDIDMIISSDLEYFENEVPYLLIEKVKTLPLKKSSVRTFEKMKEDYSDAERSFQSHLKDLDRALTNMIETIRVEKEERAKGVTVGYWSQFKYRSFGIPPAGIPDFGGMSPSEMTDTQLNDKQSELTNALVGLQNSTSVELRRGAISHMEAVEKLSRYLELEHVGTARRSSEEAAKRAAADEDEKAAEAKRLLTSYPVDFVDVLKRLASLQELWISAQIRRDGVAANDARKKMTRIAETLPRLTHVLGSDWSQSSHYMRLIDVALSSAAFAVAKAGEEGQPERSRADFEGKCRPTPHGHSKELWQNVCDFFEANAHKATGSEGKHEIVVNKLKILRDGCLP